MIERLSTSNSPASSRRGVDLADPELYFNRELSWLEFNERVLELAEDAGVPLLERLKFVAITSNNLDEFFMVRVAGLHDQVDAGIETPLQDGRTPRETLDAIRARGRASSCERQARCLQDELRPALDEHGIRIVAPRRRLRPASASCSTSASGARSSRS